MQKKLLTLLWKDKLRKYKKSPVHLLSPISVCLQFINLMQ